MQLEGNFDKAASERESVAISFTQGHIRVMQLENRGGVHHVRSFAEFALKKGDIEKGVITNPEQMAEKIISGIIDVEPSMIDTPYVACYIPQKHVFLTTIEIPSIKKEEIKDMLDHKVEGLIPMPINETYWDWHRISATGHKTRVQLAAVPKSIVDSYMKTFDKAHLVPLLIESSSMSLARSLELADNKLTPTTVSVEIAEKEAVISVIRNKEILFTTETGFSSEGVDDVTRLLAKNITSLINYAHSHGHKPEEDVTVLLYGHSDGVKNLVPALSTATGHKVEELSINKKGEQIIKIVSGKRVASLMPLIGLAIRGLPNYPSKTSINLIPQTAKEAFSRSEVANVLRNYIAYVALNISLIVLLLAVVYLRVNNQILETTQRYSAVLGIEDSQRVKEIEESIHELNLSSRIRNVLVDQIYDWQIVVEQINRATPSDITLSGLDVQYRRSASGAYVGWDVSIAGKAATRNSVLKFVDDLRLGEVFTNVKLPIDSFSSEENVSFVIEAELSFDTLRVDTNEES